MNNVIFTSDNHYGHTNIIQYCLRPYTDTREMEKDLIDRFNEVSSPDTVVYHLGDFSMQPRFVELILPQLIRKEIHLYMGNHDRCFRDEKFIKKYREWGFDTVQHFGRFSHPLLDKKGIPFVNLCHLPYLGSGDNGEYNGDEERHSPYRLENDGNWLWHGHSHSKPAKRVRGKMVDVGVDANNYYPVTVEELVGLIK